MARALASAGLADRADAFRLVFQSIGTASPGNAAAIALGLGVPVTLVMEALYRAPAVLVDGLTEEAGTQLRDLLRHLGCAVTLDPEQAPPPASGRLFDVALYVTDTARFDEVTRALANFIGISAEQAGRLVSTPPGMVLGKVSRATIDALADRLGRGADLIASDPDAALYDVFLGPCDPSVRARLLADLRRRKMTVPAEGGCLLAGLSRAEADALWNTHQRVAELRIVNRDFLRFDLVMTGGALSPAAERALIDVAGIPAHIVPRLFEGGEITVMEAVPSAGMMAALEHLASAGLAVRADCVSFLRLELEVTEAPRPRVVSDALRTVGFDIRESDLRRLPYRLPCPLPELQARLLRDTLACAGARAELIDTFAGGTAP